jgi:hypothetical protein
MDGGSSGMSGRRIPPLVPPGSFGAFHYREINSLWKAGISCGKGDLTLLCLRSPGKCGFWDLPRGEPCLVSGARGWARSRKGCRKDNLGLAS